ncbi:MAG: hypothetical protein K9N55_06570 [Phycisphaerae bacterium]|nr:hypothetical protein [Phycisphaerae bacterium]
MYDNPHELLASNQTLKHDLCGVEIWSQAIKKAGCHCLTPAKIRMGDTGLEPVTR